MLLSLLLTVSLFQFPAKASISCNQVNVGPLEFSALKSIIKTCKLSTIDSLLALLPTEYKERYTLIYGSNSLQQASPDFPRVVLFGNSAKLLMAFNGDSTSRGYKTLETTEFDSKSRKFIYRSIDFSGASPTFSGKNPKLCLGCHQADPRPNWDGYFLWPGVFGAEDDSMFFRNEGDSTKIPVEKALFKRYLVHRTEGRYQYLSEFKSLSQVTDPNAHDSEGHVDYFGRARHNLGLTIMLSGLNGQRISRKIAENRAARPFRYALLASMNCNAGNFQDKTLTQIDTYIPDKLRDRFSLPFQKVFSDAQALARKSFDVRINRHFALTGLTRPEDARTAKYFDDPTLTLEGTATWNTASPFLYLAQGIKGLDPSDWSMEVHLDGSNYYGMDAARGLVCAAEEFYWKDALDPVHDSEPYQIMVAAAKRGWEFFQPRFADPAEEEKYCKLLRDKSLAELSH